MRTIGSSTHFREGEHVAGCLAALRGEDATEAHLALAERVLAEHPAGTLEPLTGGAVAWATSWPARNLGRPCTICSR